MIAMQRLSAILGWEYESIGSISCTGKPSRGIRSETLRSLPTNFRLSGRLLVAAACSLAVSILAIAPELTAGRRCHLKRPLQPINR